MRSLILIIIVVVNLSLCILPLVALPALLLYDGEKIHYMGEIILAMEVVLFVVMLLFCVCLILNLVFGFSVLKHRIKLRNYRLSLRYGGLLKSPFIKTKKILNLHNTNLMINSNAKMDWYTIASMGRSIICLNVGLLDTVKLRTQTDEEFKRVMLAIVMQAGMKIKSCHYFTEDILRINNTIARKIQNMIGCIFSFLYNILMLIPLFGEPFAKVFRFIQFCIDSIIKFINKSLMLLYKAVYFASGKNHDYYFAKQTAKIIGGRDVELATRLTREVKFGIINMANRRIAKLGNITQQDRKIRFWWGNLQITITMLLMFSILIFLGYHIEVWNVMKYIANIYHNVMYWVTS